MPDQVALNINIAGFKLLSNGASFNITDQLIYSGETPINIKGNPIVTDTDGNKSDGYIDDQNKLTCSYHGVLLMNDNGIEYNLPFTALYELKKKA